MLLFPILFFLLFLILPLALLKPRKVKDENRSDNKGLKEKDVMGLEKQTIEDYQNFVPLHKVINGRVVLLIGLMLLGLSLVVRNERRIPPSSGSSTLVRAVIYQGSTDEHESVKQEIYRNYPVPPMFDRELSKIHFPRHTGCAL